MNWKRYLRNFILIMVGIVTLLLTVDMISKRNRSLLASSEAREVADNKIVKVTAETFPGMIESNLGKPQLFFFYASWCPFCKRQFAGIDQIREHYGKDKIRIHYLSVDDDLYLLAEFLRKDYPDFPFIPYNLSPFEREAVQDKLRAMGFTPKGSIPFSILLDRSGKPAKQFTGLTDVKYLLENIEKLL